MTFIAKPCTAIVGMAVVALLAASPAHAGGGDDGAAPIWEGAYAGVFLAYREAGARIEARGQSSREFVDEAAAAGGYFGWNFTRPNSHWVWGAEFDVTGGENDRRWTDASHGAVRVGNNFTASARLRGGYAFGGVLAYATVGLALSDLEVHAAGLHDDAMRLGLVFGGGLEVALGDNWRGRLEALSIGYAGEDDWRIAGVRRDVGLGEAQVRLGLTRRF